MIASVVGVFMLSPRKEVPLPQEEITREKVRAGTRRMIGALEIFQTEYTEGVETGRVVKGAEYEGAKEALKRATETFKEVGAYIADRELVSELGQILDRLDEMAEDLADETAVVREVTRATQLLAKLL